MTKICGSGRGQKVLVMLLIAALMFASTIINSYGRPLSSVVAQEEQEEEEDDDYEQKQVLELSSRDEMVRMAGYGEDKLSTVLITGMLVCNRACLKASHGHRDQLPGLPISGMYDLLYAILIIYHARITVINVIFSSFVHARWSA